MTGVPSLASLVEAVRGATADRSRRAHLDAQLTVAARMVEQRQEELRPLEQAQADEVADVERLARLSPTRVWATMRGDLEERRAVEQAEADAAGRAAAGARARLDHALSDARRIREERDGLGDVDGAFDRALEAYEAGLELAGAPQATELAHLAENLGRMSAEQREIDEAAAALHDARGALDHALARLDSAGGWATYDTFFGGGMVADLIKHSRIDESTRAFVEVNRALERLTVELADIDAPAVRGAEISETLAIFDVLFDNILSDWMVHDRIARAREGALDLRSRLGALADDLAQRAADVAGVIAAINGRREEILTSV